MSRATIGGWKTGASVPKLSEIETICALTKVDWQWLMTGATTDCRALSYAYFPVCAAGGGRQAEARVLSRSALFLPGDSAEWRGYARAVAALRQEARGDPRGDEGEESGGGTEEERVAAWRAVPLEKGALGEAQRLLRRMRSDFAGLDRPPGGLPAANAAPPGAAGAGRAREPAPFVLNARGVPVVGEAAADETRGRKTGFFPSDPEARYDELSFPETTAAVRIIGDSMSPVLLDGQYALLGPEYWGAGDRPRNYDIVVADVEADSGEPWTGVYCKRVVDAGDVWVFLSVNASGTPFSAAKPHCRLWPVIGVWFAGRGTPPEA